MRFELPETVGIWNVTIDGSASLKMRHEEFTLPKITFGDKEFKAAGLAGPINLPNGQITIGEVTLPVIGDATDLMKARHVCNVDGVSIVLTAKNKRGGCGKTTSKTSVVIVGRLAEFDPGQLKSGEDNMTTLMFKPISVRVKVSGKGEAYLMDTLAPEKCHIWGEKIGA